MNRQPYGGMPPANLESGEAWIYSPHFLGLKEPVRIRFPRRSTFDSELLIDVYPKSIEREALSEQLGYARSSRNTYLQRLAAGHLVTSMGTTVRASDGLF